jgi:hypothetical protein
MHSRNKLLQMQLVIDLYLEHKTADRSNRWVLKHIICPVYPISEWTLYSYLRTPVKKLLKELDGVKEDNQLKLF